MYLGRAERYISVILSMVHSGYTLVLRMLAEDLCRNDNDVSFRDHKNDYIETNQTTGSNLHELRRDVKKGWDMYLIAQNKTIIILSSLFA